MLEYNCAINLGQIAKWRIGGQGRDICSVTGETITRKYGLSVG